MAYPRRGWCTALAAREGTAQAAYAGGWIYYPTGVKGAIFKSTDFGATWESLASSPPDTITGIVADYHAGPRIYCSTTGGLYRSIDEGRNWTKPISQRGLRSVGAKYFYIAAGGDSGIWFSRDYGETWAKLDSGLGSTRVKTLAFLGHDPPWPWLWLLAGTTGGAVFYWDFPVTGLAGPHAPAPACAQVATVCRNRLTLTLDRPAQVRLLDVTGRTRLSQALPSGKAELDISALPSGVYQLIGSRPLGRVIINR